jgi:hypothetical protein
MQLLGGPISPVLWYPCYIGVSFANRFPWIPSPPSVERSQLQDSLPSICREMSASASSKPVSMWSDNANGCRQTRAFHHLCTLFQDRYQERTPWIELLIMEWTDCITSMAGHVHVTSDRHVDCHVELQEVSVLGPGGHGAPGCPAQGLAQACMRLHCIPHAHAGRS